jgi:hypothetical protein
MRSIELVLSLAALACSVRTPAQTAALTIVGAGCATAEGAPTLGHVGLPVSGQSFDLTYTGPNHQPILLQSDTQPVLVIGFTPLGPIAIPAGLLPAQPAGCTLWCTHDVVVPMSSDPLVRGRYANTLTIPIGSDPALLGVGFVAQWLAIHVQCGIAGCGPLPDWIGTSEAALCTIGV